MKFLVLSFVHCCCCQSFAISIVGLRVKDRQDVSSVILPNGQPELMPRSNGPSPRCLLVAQARFRDPPCRSALAKWMRFTYGDNLTTDHVFDS